MLPNLQQALNWLKANPNAVKQLRRGLEREALRFQKNHHIAQSDHPVELGAALTNPWITTDFSESLMEFVSPVKENAGQLLDFLGDVHKFTYQFLGEERLWPMSMPCFIEEESKIRLAQYGTSNIGQYKTLYREGLKSRYGALMQTISGVHYNFSFSEAYWQNRFPTLNEVECKAKQSHRYLNLIRNYLRYGWVIPYLFGASPLICKTFIRGRETALPFEESPTGFLYLPYATSLRLSDLGYTTDTQQNLGVTYNTLEEYCDALYKACHQPWDAFKAIDKRAEQLGKPLQLNANILQFEAEFYAWIRPKQIPQGEERVTEALRERGIEYVEVRALDVNPYADVGINADQIQFLDLFMIWCELAEAPQMSEAEQLCCKKNWNRVILEGRKPGKTIGIGCGESELSLVEFGERIFNDLEQVADVLDKTHTGKSYRQVCDALRPAFANPELTLSARVLHDCLTNGLSNFATGQAEKFKQHFMQRDYQQIDNVALTEMAKQSRIDQLQIETDDKISFREYLVQKNQA